MNNLRQKRMNKIIFTSFKELLLENKFSDISITMIANQALIHRNTVYHHFTDKYDLLNKYIEYEVQNFPIDFSDFETQPFKNIHDLFIASFEKIMHYQQDDHDFNLIIQNCFLKLIVNAQNNDQIFWFIGKIAGILLWNDFHNSYYDLIRDYRELDKIYQTNSFPDVD